jgi:hypothetical protein
MTSRRTAGTKRRRGAGPLRLGFDGIHGTPPTEAHAMSTLGGDLGRPTSAINLYESSTRITVEETAVKRED